MRESGFASQLSSTLALNGSGVGGSFHYTNLLPYSERFDLWNVNAVTVTADTTVAPDGATTADTLASVVNGQVYWFNVPIEPNSVYTWSCYMKAASAQVASLYLHGQQDGTPEVHQQFAITTSWQRFSVSGTTGATVGGFMGCYIGGYNEFDNQTIFAWGAQLNKGPTPTLYVKTSGTPVT